MLFQILSSRSHRPPSGPQASPEKDALSRVGSAPRGARVALVALLLLPSFGAWGTAQGQSDPFSTARRSMVSEQVVKRGIETPVLLDAMQDVPRHLFVPEGSEPRAYEDMPVTIAPGKTLSQAYVSARMISLLELEGDEKVLEIGTGSGYDAALLSQLASEVFTIEIDRGLGEKAKATLERLGYENVHVEVGDGYRGWPSEAPFDAILITAAPERIPEPLLAQLKDGGRMVVAVGGLVQDLQVVTKSGDEIQRRTVSLVNLSPMTGEVQRDQDRR